MKTILDVGCGSKPWGTLNLDLYQDTSQHHKFSYDPKEIEKFVNGDGSRLPYRDKSVDIIVSRHCLEHIPEPLLAIREWERVAREAVVIMVPNNPTVEEHNAHLYSWSLVSFENFLSQIFPQVTVWANSPINNIMRNKIFRRLIRIGLIKKPMQRFLSKWLGLQLTAICVCKDSKIAEEPYPIKDILEEYPVIQN